MNDPLPSSDGSGQPAEPRDSQPNADTWRPDSAAASPLATPQGWRRISRPVCVGLGALMLAAILGIFVPGELGSFLVAAWEVVLFAALCVLSYVGLEAKSARILSVILLGLLLGFGVFSNGLFAFLAVTPDPDSQPAEGSLTLAALVGCLSLAAASLAALVQWPGFRKAATRLTGNYEWTSVRRLALGAVVAFTALCVVPLAALGEPPLLIMLGGSPDPSSIFEDGRGAAGVLRDQMYSLSWTLVAAFLAVGYGVVRNGSETLDRLGLQPVTTQHLVWSAALTALLVGLAWLLDQGITRLWEAFRWRTTDLTALELLFAPFLSVTGAVVIAITAGLGEEVAVRGVLQPRLGILLSNLFFTSLHAYQYNWDGLLSVFVIGLALGWIRRKTNTSVSALVHGGYDFVLVMMEVAAQGKTP